AGIPTRDAECGLRTILQQPETAPAGAARPIVLAVFPSKLDTVDGDIGGVGSLTRARSARTPDTNSPPPCTARPRRPQTARPIPRALACRTRGASRAPARWGAEAAVQGIRGGPLLELVAVTSIAFRALWHLGCLVLVEEGRMR